MATAHPTFEPMRRSTPLAAAQRYRLDDLAHRVAAATPSQLVAMLYEAMRVAAVAAERATLSGDAVARLRQVTRALAILDGLESSLDHGRGGAVARTLAAAYAQIRALLVAGNIETSPDLFAAASARIATIGMSWSTIAKDRYPPD